MSAVRIAACLSSLLALAPCAPAAAQSAPWDWDGRIRLEPPGLRQVADDDDAADAADDDAPPLGAFDEPAPAPAPRVREGSGREGSGREGSGLEDTPLEDSPLDNSPLDPNERGPGAALIRLELSGRMVWLSSSKIKEGPAGEAHTIRPRSDADLPGIPQFGYRALIDVKLHEKLLVGGFYTHLLVRTERRGVREKLGTDRETIPSSARGRTLIDMQLSEVFVRYVVFDQERIRLSFGVGGVYASFRFRFDGDQGERGDSRVAEYFASVNYTVQFRLAGPVSLYIESMFGFLAPHSLLSYVSEFRAGARVELLPGMQLILAVSSLTGQVQEYEDVWGGKRTGDHHFRKADWSFQGFEVGLAYRY